MAIYGGTTQKCKACEKTVYLVEQLTADNKVFHKSCFRCHHCKGTLKLSNYSSFEGVFYCKPHYDQLFKMTGSLDKSFEGTPKTANRSVEQGNSKFTNSRFSSIFGGTQEKCVACKKTVYPIEKVLTWRLRDQPIELHNARATSILQASPQSNLQDQRKL
ncbi:hypothetical protein ACFE04_027744 [Oxalis oulophora]